MQHDFKAKNVCSQEVLFFNWNNLGVELEFNLNPALLKLRLRMYSDICSAF